MFNLRLNGGGILNVTLLPGDVVEFVKRERGIPNEQSILEVHVSEDDEVLSWTEVQHG